MSILVFNAGSSTLKFVLFADDPRDELASGAVDWKSNAAQAVISFRTLGAAPRQQTAAVNGYADAVAHALRRVGESHALADVRACGHRIVHGGERFLQSVRIDTAVRQAIGALAELAPLHNPSALAGIEAAAKALPGVLQVGVFDTAFFAEQPPERFLYPVPLSWYADWGIRRFRFHGTTPHYCSRRAADLLTRDDAR